MSERIHPFVISEWDEPKGTTTVVYNRSDIDRFYPNEHVIRLSEDSDVASSFMSYLRWMASNPPPEKGPSRHMWAMACIALHFFDTWARDEMDYAMEQEEEDA